MSPPASEAPTGSTAAAGSAASAGSSTPAERAAYARSATPNRSTYLASPPTSPNAGMRLRLFYLCYYTAVAVNIPFFPPYLRNLGLSGHEVSLMLSLSPFFHLGVPLVWGWLADRTQRPDRLLQVACGGACLFLLPLVKVRHMPAMLGFFALHQAFSVPITGLSDGLALERVRNHGEDYSRIRLWGSVSFIVACLAFGPVLAARGPRGGDPLVPALLAGAMGLAFVAALRLHGQGGRELPHLDDVRKLVRDRRFLLLLLLAPLHWMALAPYHGFFAILLQDSGHSPNVVAAAFFISVVGELIALYLFRRIRERAALSTVLLVSFGATILRWVATARLQSPVALALLQATHALTFGLFWAACLAWLVECVPPKLRATGQTLFTAATFGLGNLIGMLSSGTIYDRWHSARPAFLAAAALELVPFTLVWVAGRRLDPSRPRPA